ncbi:MAG: hypothetical protein KDD70_01865 [Bdellovibrionales bacterium]|nr:hypothetical protein [Bdellovibrionales bacterium]
MARVALKDLEIGSVLSNDVLDQSGRILLKAGSTIEEKHFKIFKTWGIRTVEIHGQETSETLVLTEDQLGEGLQHAESLLKLNQESHELIQMLRGLIQRRYARKLAEAERS